MDLIGRYFDGLGQTLELLDRSAITAAIQWLHETRLARRQIFIFGNGGSASTATHFACDLSKNTSGPYLPDFRVIGLADNVALLTAFGNDEGYGSVFARQLSSLCQPNDLAIAISTSGRSPNVVQAVRIAKELGARTIGFTGYNGGDLRALVDLEVHVPSNCIEHVEDVHLVLEHLITMALREMAFDVVTSANGSYGQEQSVGVTD